MADERRTEYREREDKYDVDAAFVLPDLSAELPPGGRIEPAEFRLTSTYYDTAGADLRRNRLTLRRREGDTDTGWHLKLPASKATNNARTEVRLADAPELPEQLSRVLTGVRRGADLVPVARLVTHRTVHRLVDKDGQLLAEVADDAVSATDLSAGDAAHGGSVTALQWREVEVEAGPAAASASAPSAPSDEGDPAETLLSAVGAALVAAGARASKSSSKLARALGPAAQRPPLGKDSTLADVVSDYIATQCAVIVAGDLGLRLEHDVTHPTRVGIRRLRSTLRTFAPLFDADAAAALETELVWFAGLLGGVRDADVLRVRLDRLVAELPDDLVMGPVAARIDNALAAERAEHWRDLLAALDSPRLLALLGLVEQWRLAPPFVDAAHGPVNTVPAKRVGKHLKRARRKLQKRMKHAARPGAKQEELVHKARKAGKRFRYAAELAEPVLGSKASDQAADAEALQDLLGEHQDSVVSVAALRRFGAAAGTAPGENGFTFGILLEAELQRGAEIRAQIAAREKTG
jgi:CHAD domain-containing protein